MRRRRLEILNNLSWEGACAYAAFYAGTLHEAVQILEQSENHKDGMFGIEGCNHGERVLEYINVSDPYVTTVLDTRDGLEVGSYGDWIEMDEREDGPELYEQAWENWGWSQFTDELYTHFDMSDDLVEWLDDRVTSYQARNMYEKYADPAWTMDKEGVVLDEEDAAGWVTEKDIVYWLQPLVVQLLNDLRFQSLMTGIPDQFSDVMRHYWDSKKIEKIEQVERMYKAVNQQKVECVA